jgi:O-antigen ligase
LGPLISTARAFLPLGAGFGSFDSVYRQFEPNQLLSTIYLNQAHTEPLQLAIEGGLPALALLGVFIWCWARAVTRIGRANPSTGQHTMGVAVATVTGILMISSLVDYPLRTPLLSAVFAFAFVEMSSAGRRRRTSGTHGVNLNRTVEP